MKIRSLAKKSITQSLERLNPQPEPVAPPSKEEQIGALQAKIEELNTAIETYRRSYAASCNDLEFQLMNRCITKRDAVKAELRALRSN